MADSSANPDCNPISTLTTELAAASGSDKITLAEQYLVDFKKLWGLSVRCATEANFYFHRQAGWGTSHVAGDVNGWGPAFTDGTNRHRVCR